MFYIYGGENIVSNQSIDNLKQYETTIAANRQTAKRSKYIIEFLLCIIPSKKRTLLTSFQHTVVSTKDEIIIAKGSVFKNAAIHSDREFFVTNSDYQLTRAVVEHLIEQRIGNKAFTFQVYVISETKIDEYNTGFTIRAIANNKMTEIIKKRKKGKSL